MHCQVIMIMLVNNKSLNKVNKQDLKFSLQLRLSQTSYESMRKRGGEGGGGVELCWPSVCCLILSCKIFV